LNLYWGNKTKRFICHNGVHSLGGNIPRKDKKGDLETPTAEPEKTGRPVVFLAGLIVLFIGLFIALGSVVHNILLIGTNETSHMVFGPLDWMAAIVGAVVLLVGIILLMFSKAPSPA
jgi:hypothetical protein